MFDEDESLALKRKEKRIAILTVISFVIGIALTFGTYLNFILTATSDSDIALGSSFDDSESIQSLMFAFGGLLVIGPLLIGAAFLLANWWTRVQHRRNRLLYWSWMD